MMSVWWIPVIVSRQCRQWVARSEAAAEKAARP